MLIKRNRPKSGTEPVRSGSIAEIFHTGPGTDCVRIASLYSEGGEAARHSAAQTGGAKNQNFTLHRTALQDPFDPDPAELGRKQQPGGAEPLDKRSSCTVVDAGSSGNMNRDIRHPHMKGPQKSRIGYTESRYAHCSETDGGIDRSGKAFGRNRKVHGDAEAHTPGKAVFRSLAKCILRQTAASCAAIAPQAYAHHIRTAGYGGAECRCAPHTGH